MPPPNYYSILLFHSYTSSDLHFLFLFIEYSFPFLHYVFDI